MSSEQVERPSGRFHPTTLREVFALQLAQRLQDEDKLRTYLDLLRTYPVPFLLDVFEAAKESTTTPDEIRERFWSKLREQSDWRQNE
jgi:hypothetical protein